MNKYKASKIHPQWVKLVGRLLSNNDFVLYCIVYICSKTKLDRVSREELESLGINVDLIEFKDILFYHVDKGNIDWEGDILDDPSVFNDIFVNRIAEDYIHKQAIPKIQWAFTTTISILALILSIISFLMSFPKNQENSNCNTTTTPVQTSDIKEIYIVNSSNINELTFSPL